MVDFDYIFTHQSDKYDKLVQKEDYQDNLINALLSITNLNGKRILEIGAGTGRLTFKLCPHVQFVHAFEKSKNMLQVAITNKKNTGISNCEFFNEASENIPIFETKFDIAVAGWSFMAVIAFSEFGFEEKNQNSLIKKVLNNLINNLENDGMIIIIETLGLGTFKKKPEIPDIFQKFYEVLENVYHFKRKEIRTDYKFNNLEEAIDLITFFFGEENRDYIISQNKTIIPECTGIWYLNRSDFR